MNPSNISQLRRNSRREDDDRSSNGNASDYQDDLLDNKIEKSSNTLILPPPNIGSNSRSTPANMNQVTNPYAPDPGLSSIFAPSGVDSFHDATDITFKPECTPTTARFDHLGNNPPLRSVSFADNLSTAVPTIRHTPSPIETQRSGSWSGVNESDEGTSSASEIHNITGNSDIGASTSTASYGSMERTNADGIEGPSQQYIENRDIKAEKMRLRLKFHFMNPIEKWHARNRFPWKLLIQVIKIFVVTTQLVLFAQQRYSHVSYLWDTRVSFSHIFLKGWDSTREIHTYPPNDGPLAVYTKQQFYDYLDFASISYQHLPEMSIGTYIYHQQNGTVLPSQICCQQYNKEYTHHVSSCIPLPWDTINSTEEWSVKDYLEQQDFPVRFDKLLACNYTFKVMAVKQRTPPTTSMPDCYNLTSSIVFDNADRDGQMLVGLDIVATVLSCHDPNTTTLWNTTSNKTLNCITIILCVLSLFTCLRSLYRAQMLRHECGKFFRSYYYKEMTLSDKLEFLNLWYVIICVNDLLIIVGSLLKIGLESRFIGDTTVQALRIHFKEFVKGSLNYEGYLDTWNVCSLFLGVGNLLVWFGCIRYLGFFRTYNVLILTLKKCLPNVLRYSICIMLLFGGYCFCGWVVLSPYHIKFHSLSSTMECLYSLINGDDMYATFSSTNDKDPVIWWFSRIYLYSFISLFIYVILSLFLAIIMDAYDTIKKYYEDGFPLSPLKKFVEECREEPTSRVFHDEGDRTIHDMVNGFFCFCFPNIRTRQASPDETQPLVT